MAMPDMGDTRFERSVIYLHHHDDEGAVGFVINRPMAMSVSELLEAASSDDESGSVDGRFPPLQRNVGYGGPVEEARGFVLHCERDGTGISVDASLEALRGLARSGSDDRALVVLGYAGWGAGQLEAEISQNVWLTGELDPQPLFRAEADHVYPMALRQIGVELSQLSSSIGHA